MPGLHVAFKAPPLPAYYTPDEGKTQMDLSAQIDRGDIWYDVPFDARGKPIVQRRDHYPHLTLFVNWHGQKIPLVKWRTTIGSWRSEMHADGHVYMKYKNSDIGPRVWRQIVATPVWIPPDGTPAKDLLKTKVLDRKVGPVTVVNTDVMGPGYQSAYGLVMGIHIDPKRGGFDNQIRTHGSVDYTSIARRFSHGCHRLVNNRAVRLFDFVLRHRALPPHRRRAAEPQEALRGRGRDLPLRAHDARLLLRAGRAHPDRRARRARHGRGEEADHRVRAQAGRRLQRRSGRGRRGGVDGDRGARRADRSPAPDASRRRLRSRWPPRSRRGSPRPRPTDAAATVARRDAPSGPATDLDVTLDPDAPAHLRATRACASSTTARRALSTVSLRGCTRTRSPSARAALNDVSFHWLYPGGFSPGAIELANLRIDGAPAPVTIDDVPFVGAAGDRQRAAAGAARARCAPSPSTSTSSPGSRAATARSAATAPAAA